MTSEIRSLHELCFENIRINISRHSSAYRSTNDPTLKKNLSFLQRFHSHNLVEELIKYKELAEEHFDFLLNDFLKRLVITPLLRCSSKETIADKVLPIAHNLQELSSVCEDYNDEDYLFILKKILPHSTNLKALNIPYICSDELLTLIASSCPHLVKLSVQESIVTGAGIKALCSDSDGKVKVKCPLKYLNLCDNSIEMEDMAFVLQNMPTLEDVLFQTLPETIEYIHSIDETLTFSLHSLDFRYEDPSQVAKLMKICIAKCPEIRSLSVPIWSDSDLELVNHFSKLETLALLGSCDHDDNNPVDLNQFFVRKGREIKHLTVDSLALSVTKLIENCPNLETLILKNILWQQLDKGCQKPLMKLRDLLFDSVIFLDFNHIESVMAVLNSSPGLESLSMQYCDFSESDIVSNLSAFSQNCNLNSLKFECTDIGVDLLQQFIINCNSIQTLNLDSCEKIGLDDVAMLQQTVDASNRKIEISFVDAHADFSYSDYGIEDEDDFDFHFYGEYDGYSDEDDDDENEYNDYDYFCDEFDL